MSEVDGGTCWECGTKRERIQELESKIERLTSRGIEDMKFRIKELEAENLRLKEALEVGNE
jgi:hypothetical protein